MGVNVNPDGTPSGYKWTTTPGELDLTGQRDWDAQWNCQNCGASVGTTSDTIPEVYAIPG